MRRMFRRPITRTLGALILVLLVSACGTAPSATLDPAPTPAPVATFAIESVQAALPAVDPAAVSGDISVAGSSTVFPLTEHMAELFTDDGYADQITIDSVGTGGGFERFCVAGETDIANASRPIKDEEIAACRAINREPIAFRVGTDALAVVVSAENSFLSELSLEQLAAIFNGEAQRWNNVDPSYPAEAIQLFSPGSDSGTYDYFVEEVLAEDNTQIQASGAQFSENDNVLVQGVAGSPYAIGYLLMTSLIAMLVAMPLGLGAALYLSEYASPRVRAILKPTLDKLQLQQAGRIADHTAFFLMDKEDRAGQLIEYGPTGQIFQRPRDEHTEQYISGRFG